REVLLEPSSGLRARAMQEDSLMGAGDAENVTRLVAGQALDIAQQHHLLLQWRKIAHGARQQATQALPFERIVRALERRWPVRPMADPLALTEKPLRLDGWAVGRLFGDELGNRHQPLPAADW